MHKDKIYNQRVASLRKIMKAEKLDLILVYASWHEYSFGVFLNGMKPLQYQYFFVKPETEGFLVPDYVLKPYELDIHPNSIGFVEAKINQELADFTGQAKRVGIIGPAPAKHLKKIKAKLVFLEKEISLLMAKKNKAELDSIKEARRVSEKLLKDLEKKIKPGVRLDLLAKELEDKLIKEVGGLAFPVIIYSEKRKKSILSSFGFPDKVAQKDLIMVDIGAEKNGLMSDLNRMYTVGLPEFKKQYELLLKAHQKVVKKLRVGALLCKIPKLYEEEFARVGLDYESFNKEKMGLSIGFSLMELPYIGEDLFVKYKIQKGMAITIILKIKIKGKVMEMQDTLVFDN